MRRQHTLVVGVLLCVCACASLLSSVESLQLPMALMRTRSQLRTASHTTSAQAIRAEAVARAEIEGNKPQLKCDSVPDVVLLTVATPFHKLPASYKPDASYHAVKVAGAASSHEVT